MKPKTIIFVVVLIIWLIATFSSIFYVRSLDCDKLIITASNNGSNIGLCDEAVLRSYEATLVYCANISVVK